MPMFWMMAFVISFIGVQLAGYALVSGQVTTVGTLAMLGGLGVASLAVGLWASGVLLLWAWRQGGADPAARRRHAQEPSDSARLAGRH